MGAVLTFQPTIRRAYASITKATYTKPAQVWTYVKSTTHNALGRLTRNSRFTLSSGHGVLGLLTVVIVVFPSLTPAKPMARISRSTVHLATVAPSLRIWCQTLRVP